MLGDLVALGRDGGDLIGEFRALLVEGLQAGVGVVEHLLARHLYVVVHEGVDNLGQPLGLFALEGDGHLVGVRNGGNLNRAAEAIGGRAVVLVLVAEVDPARGICLHDGQHDVVAVDGVRLLVHVLAELVVGLDLLLLVGVQVAQVVRRDIDDALGAVAGGSLFPGKRDADGQDHAEGGEALEPVAAKRALDVDCATGAGGGLGGSAGMDDVVVHG